MPVSINLDNELREKLLEIAKYRNITIETLIQDELAIYAKSILIVQEKNND